MKGKILNSQQKTAKSTGHPFWVVTVLCDGNQSIQLTTFQQVTVGKTYDFEIRESGIYKSMTQIAESYDPTKEAWIEEKKMYMHQIQQKDDEIKLLKEQITFLKDLVKK
jgi:hypothetical protein